MHKVCTMKEIIYKKTYSLPKKKITLHYTDISRSSMETTCIHWRQILSYNSTSYDMQVGAI